MSPAPAAPAATPAPQIPRPRPKQSLSYSHMRTLQPIAAPVTTNQPPSGAATPDPAILSLANNNDLNVSTLARQAQKAKHGDEPPQDEVVVSLH